MANSRRHHYLPQFYLKNFANDDGFFHVYNKKTQKFYSDKSTKSMFFGWDRNLINIQGVETDAFEKIYSELDNKMAPALERILATKKISPEDWMSILIFISVLKWRIPGNDSQFDKLKQELTYGDLPIEIRPVNKDGATDKAALEHIINSKTFQETKRLILPFLPFYNNELIESIYKNSYINTNERFTCIVGDMPLIEGQKSHVRDMESFIFPLSASDTFIYKNGETKAVSSIEFYALRDLAIFHLSDTYIACKDKAHLEKIVAAYKECVENNFTHFIVQSLFSCV